MYNSNKSLQETVIMLSNCKESDSLSTTVSSPSIVFATEEIIFTE